MMADGSCVPRPAHLRVARHHRRVGVRLVLDAERLQARQHLIPVHLAAACLPLLLALLDGSSFSTAVTPGVRVREQRIQGSKC